jgi:hypothetical protein
MSFAQTIVSPKPLETFSAKELIDLWYSIQQQKVPQEHNLTLIQVAQIIFIINHSLFVHEFHRLDFVLYAH